MKTRLFATGLFLVAATFVLPAQKLQIGLRNGLNVSSFSEISELNAITKSIKEISIKMQLSRWVISNILKKNNIITNRSHRKIKINENLFSNINHDSSYLIGLICSDGSIDNNGYGFQISSKDIEILEYCNNINHLIEREEYKGRLCIMHNPFYIF